MATTATRPAVDEERLTQFVFRAVEEVGATLNAALVVMGDKLGLYRALALREDGDAMMRALPVPDGTVAGIGERARGALLVGGLDFLQADDVGLGFIEPFQEPRQPAVHPVDVVRRHFHRMTSARCRIPTSGR